jgi:hypothetical protein
MRFLILIFFFLSIKVYSQTKFKVGGFKLEVDSLIKNKKITVASLNIDGIRPGEISNLRSIPSQFLAKTIYSTTYDTIYKHVLNVLKVQDLSLVSVTINYRGTKRIVSSKDTVYDAGIILKYIKIK